MQANPDSAIEPQRTHWRWAFALCLAVVLVLALLPPRFPMPSTGWDKVNHALAFAVLAVLGGWSYPGRTAQVLAGLLAYGGLIELLQALTGYRSPEWLDLAADAVGLSFGWALMRASGRYRAMAAGSPDS